MKNILTMSGEDLACNAVSLSESTQYSFSEVGGGDVVNRTFNHASKYPYNPEGEGRKGGEGGRERGGERGRERVIATI